MKKKIFLTIASVLMIILLMPLSAFADDSKDNKDNDENEFALNPQFIINEGNWKLIAFSDKVPDKIVAGKQIESYCAKLLNDMIVRQNVISNFTGKGLRSGSNQMTKYIDTPFGDSYFRSYFHTLTSWTSSPASFWGSAFGAWYGTEPEFNCDELLLQVGLDLETWLAYFDSLPNGWNNGIVSTSSPFIFTYDYWFIILPWSGVTATYSIPSYIQQTDTHIYYFEGYGDTWVLPRESMIYGE